LKVADQDHHAFGRQALEALEVQEPDRALVVGHRGGEVLPGWVDEVDPFGHGREPNGGGGKVTGS